MKTTGTAMIDVNSSLHHWLVDSNSARATYHLSYLATTRM